MMTRIGRNGDAIAGALLAALGVFIIAQALKWNVINADGPGPGFFPLGYGMAIFILSVALCAGSIMRQRAPETIETDHAEGRSGLWSALLAWAAFAGSICLMPLLGFFISLALLTFALLSLIFSKSWQTASMTALMCAIGFYVLFSLALGVDLPVGRLGI